MPRPMTRRLGTKRDASSPSDLPRYPVCRCVVRHRPHRRLAASRARGARNRRRRDYHPPASARSLLAGLAGARARRQRNDMPVFPLIKSFNLSYSATISEGVSPGTSAPARSPGIAAPCTTDRGAVQPSTLAIPPTKAVRPFPVTRVFLRC